MSYTDIDYVIVHFERALDNYLAASPNAIAKAKCGDRKMHSNRVVSLPYLNRKLANTDAFIRYKGGSRAAILACIKLMIANGVLVEVSPQVALVDYDSDAKLYYIQ